MAINMLSRSNLQGSTFEAQHGFIMEYYLIVISIACVKRKIIKPKYPVACSRSVGAAGERDLLWSMIWCCGGSACVQCLSCAAPVVIETSVMNKTCDPVSIRVQGFDPECRVPGLVFVAGGGRRFELSGFLAPVPRNNYPLRHT